MLNLAHTLDSGQVFRYFKEGDGYRVIHGGNAFFVNDEGFEGIGKGEFEKFFRLDDNYDGILNGINKDKVMAQAIKEYAGLRLIRQDPWECTVSFLCSSATNIPRIKRDLNNIAKTFGSLKNGFHMFPKIGEIDNLKKLQKCGVGFRAKYIIAVNDSLNSSFFQKLRRFSYTEAKEKLMELPGVGPKIADCILLFSLDKLNAFPIDTWMEKVLNEHYVQKNLHSFTQQYFGEHAGYAQQFLYHWRRNKKNY